MQFYMRILDVDLRTAQDQKVLDADSLEIQVHECGEYSRLRMYPIFSACERGYRQGCQGARRIRENQMES